MDFAYSPKVAMLRERLEEFMNRLIVPRFAEWRDRVAGGEYPPAFIEDLKAQARAAGLWNLFLPPLRPDEPGTRLDNLEYAPLAEIMGRVAWASEVFNCSAPDTGNMELLHRFGTAAQRERWLVPLLEGHIRSAFAMTEPDVASADATNIQTTIRREGGDYVINGRKWFITGAAHPHCRLLIVIGKTDPEAPKHRRQSMVLIPSANPGVEIVRNLSIMHQFHPEGHCEIVLRNVRVPQENLLGDEGEGFAMAQARLGPGRIHHCMRSIGQAELAQALLLDRVRERRTFGRYLHERGVVREWIAHNRLEIDQARWLVLAAAWRIDRDGVRTARKEIAMIKAVVPRILTRVVDRTMQAFGAMGIGPDTPLPELWGWGRALRFADGPDEVHLDQVARIELESAQSRRGESAAYLIPPTAQN